MKNLFVTLSLVLTTGIAPLLANETHGDPRIEAIFLKQFSGAENVKWTKLEEGFEKVAFTLGDTRVEAYFTGEGELAGTVRNLFFSQLPLTVMQAVNNRFDGAIVLEVREITNVEGTSYRVVLEQKEKKYSVKMNSHGETLEVSKMKRK
jgi:hypothetical protein